VLSNGIVIIQDVQFLETVAIMKFTPFDEMREIGEHKNIEALTEQLMSVSKTTKTIDIKTQLMKTTRPNS
jgi:hypothetical protein